MSRPLPNEPLSQIFSELGPMDLVNLARTNKALRGVLMSRKSIWVWLTARRNAGVTKVPEPPDDMSEPAWALLLFGPAVCSVCSQESFCIVLFPADLVDSIALQGTSIESTLPFAVACAPSAGRKSEERIFHHALDDSDREINSASSMRLNFAFNALA